MTDLTTNAALAIAPQAGGATTPALALRDVRRSYGRGAGQVVALDGVTLEVPTHTWTAVMGPSGPASRPCCTWPPGSSAPTTARCGWRDTT